MQIGFANAALARTFSEFELMGRAFGAEVAYKLANRLALLSAADNLALVPTTSPIGCRFLGGESTRFAVAVPPKYWLVFRAVGRRSQATVLTNITAIDISGVE